MANKTFEANIYTPDWRFIAVLKDYISIVWTDRYYEVGDFELILPLTKENLQIYSPDNYIVCNQSDKVMIIETVITSTSSDGYKMKVTGHSAEALLKRRVTAKQILINATSDNTSDVYVIDRNTGYEVPSHFASGLKKTFEECFNQDSVELMSESSDQNAIQPSSEQRRMPAIRFAGVISDPFNHIVDAIANIDSFGDEYYDIIQDLCESKDIGFAVYRNFEREIDRSNEDDAITVDDIKKARYIQANTEALFDLVLYDGWNQTGDYLVESGVDMTTTINNIDYEILSGVIFSVEYLNLQSSDANYSKEEYKNYIYVKGDEVSYGSDASVDIANNTANFTKAYTDEDSKYYLAATNTTKDFGIFKRETFADSGISRGLNSRRKYSSRLQAKGQKILKTKKEKIVLSCEISNVNSYIYREDYYLGDLVKVKDSMDHSDIFRVTEEIISSDSAGLKVYPTLVVFDPDKYVADDSLVDTDTSSRVAVDWKFEGGKCKDISTALTIWTATHYYYNTDAEGHLTTRKRLEGVGGDVIPAATDPGTIIDTIPSAKILQEDLKHHNNDPQVLVDNMEGVVTYQIYDDFIAFPKISNNDSIIGTPNNDPNDSGTYNIEKENQELRYWSTGGTRFVPYTPSLGPEEGTLCTGYATFYAHWSPQFFKIEFNHGDNGRFSSGAFSDSYAPASEAYSTPPEFRSGFFYERTRDWYKDSWVYRPVYGYDPPIGWYDPTSSGYWQNYYVHTSKDLIDKVYEDVAYNSWPHEPGCIANSGYHRDKSKWDKEIVRATQDEVYTAVWQADDASEDEEDEDEDWGEDQDENKDDKYPVVHKKGDVVDGVYVGDEDGATVDQMGTMITFRGVGSRLFDVFLPKSLSDLSIEKKSDGPDQHSQFIYQRDIGNGFTLQAYWKQGRSAFPGVTILRSSDWACIGKFIQSTSGGTYSNPSANKGSTVNEVAFTNAPVVRPIKAFSALTSNPIAGQEDPQWPDNIYSDENFNSKVTSKPSDWDSSWRNYYEYVQVGASYGICLAAYDDLGILFNPFWIRAGLLDYPLVSVPYDTKYTSSALDLATRDNKSYVDSLYNLSGWVWQDIPNARWSGLGYNVSGNLGDLYSEKPNFHYDSRFGHQFSDASWHALKHMPSDWDENWQNYKTGSANFKCLSKGTPYSMPDNVTNIGAANWLGPHFEWGTVNPHLEEAFWGCSAGIHAPLLKQSGSGNSIIIIIKGFTSAQNVKPGTNAVFSVNAFCYVIGSSMSYTWRTSMDGGTTWTVIENAGSTYSFTATADMDGMVLTCTVHAAYGLGDETIEGAKRVPTDSGFMHLTVSDEGTDGIEPPKQEEKNKNELDDSEPPPPTDPPQDPPDSNDRPTRKRRNKAPNGKTILYTFMYIGDGSPPNTSSWSFEDFANSDDWIVTDTTEVTSGSGSDSSSTQSKKGNDLDYNTLSDAVLSGDIPVGSDALDVYLFGATDYVVQAANEQNQEYSAVTDAIDGRKATK